LIKKLLKASSTPLTPHLISNAMPSSNSGKHNNGLGTTVVVTTTTTTTTTRSNSQGEPQKQSVLSKLKGNNSNTHVTRETHTAPASAASSRSHLGRKSKDLNLNNGIGARSNNPTYDTINRRKPGMGVKWTVKWSSSVSEKTGAWRDF
jgi:hypothetical protein